MTIAKPIKVYGLVCAAYAILVVISLSGSSPFGTGHPLLGAAMAVAAVGAGYAFGARPWKRAALWSAVRQSLAIGLFCGTLNVVGQFLIRNGNTSDKVAMVVFSGLAAAFVWTVLCMVWWGIERTLDGPTKLKATGE